MGSTGYKAQLVSPVISVANGQTKCLTLWYHMYGEHVSTLTVYHNVTALWTRTGDQGDQWLQAHITLTGLNNEKVRIIRVMTRSLG